MSAPLSVPARRGAVRWRRPALPWRRLGLWLLLALFLAPTLFVFYWMVTLSLKTQVQATAYPPVLVPTQLTLQGYEQVFTRSPFVQFTANSFLIAVASTLVGLAIGAPAAYGIARWRLGGLALVVLIARMTPGISFLLPWYILFRQLGLVDSYLALTLTHLTVGLPIIIWVLIAFFEDLPPELEDAARVDGCGRYRAFWHVALPLARPGLLVAAILSFIFSWNNFLFAVVLTGPNTRTLPVAVYSLMSYQEIIWNQLAAAAFLITLPVLALTFLIQRHLVTGLTIGAVKG